MAPKKPATASGPAVGGTASTSTSSGSRSSTNRLFNKITLNIVQHYQKTTPQRTKLIDAFMAFLVIVGGLQFAYCVLAGNYVRLSLPLSSGTLGARGKSASITGPFRYERARAELLTCGEIVALQRFPLGLLRNCWTVRSHRYVASITCLSLLKLRDKGDSILTEI